MRPATRPWTCASRIWPATAETDPDHHSAYQPTEVKSMASRNTSSPLGVGVVWVPGLEPLLEPGMGLIDVVEIEPQQYWDFHPGAARPYRMQEAVLSYLNGLEQPLIVHGVGGAAGG